jgi:rare lipoprotein A
MKFAISCAVLLVFAAVAAAYCAVVDRGRRRALVRGRAAAWGDGYRGKRMANGRRFDPQAHTCASYGFPLGAVLRVRCLATGRHVIVTVTDRGPALGLGRLLDLSERAFLGIAPRPWGVIEVEVEVLSADAESKEETLSETVGNAMGAPAL